ncbi:MAG: LptF/LptG family permease [Bacteroides sp.]|nr:LptF/LptG family permease [Bacteroides sp.]MCM1095724.1 LptF/LptG family permease [Terasakiella sp.]
MFGLKRLDSFMLQRFAPLLLMTFFICLFIVLMQFLYRMIDDLVGKGLGFDVLGELFFYAALTMVPTALPLAVLLASLMVFGNLGEKLELTAMKAAGISLFRIMAPLMVLMGLIAVGAFFFQNNVLPIAQSRMWTLMFSVRQKTPEVEIPEKSFYDEIPGMNLYIDHKDPETGMLYGMIMYDMSQGSDNTRVILADSGRFSFTEDKTRLFLELHSGEMFENLTDRSLGSGTGGYMPFRREEFTRKDVYFKFDANFNRMDESGIRSQYVGQNVSQLLASIDSIGRQVDSIGTIYSNELLTAPYAGLRAYRNVKTDSTAPTVAPVTFTHDATDADIAAAAATVELDSVFMRPSPSFAKTYISQAIADARRSRQEFEYRALMLTDQAKLMRRHDIEMQRKFTLSFAVLVFFFIGAPLGAIIKKGGLGTPLVISVLLFIVYYIFDNMGLKMARDGKLAVWQGMWLSTLVLLPLGIFFTRKAIDDSAVFNSDAYRAFLLRLIGRQPGRALELKELIMQEVDPADARDRLTALAAMCCGKPDRRRLRDSLNETVDYLANSRDPMVIALLNEYPFTPTRRNIPAIKSTTEKLLTRFNDGIQR